MKSAAKVCYPVAAGECVCGASNLDDCQGLAGERLQNVVRLARIAVASYPHPESAPFSDIDYYMAELRDAVGAFDGNE